MSVTAPKLLSQAELNQQREADAERVSEVDRTIRQAAHAVFAGGGHTWHSGKSKQEKLAELDAAEVDALAVLQSVKANQSAAIRQINALGADTGMTAEQVAEHNLYEPAIRSIAESISLQGLDRELRNAIFEGNPIKQAIWARQAQVVIDRAVDAGTRIPPEKTREFDALIRQLSNAGDAAKRQKELRAPFGELSEQARKLEIWMLEARKRRGASTFGRLPAFGTQTKTVSFKASEGHNMTGYLELDEMDKIQP